VEIDDIRALSDEELEDQLDDSQRGLMNLRFRVATMQINDVNQIKSARRRVARIRTVMRERAMSGASR
jgi:large subunit ribosomal protein L29